MGEGKKCPLYRKSEGVSFGIGVGYCDIDGSSTICDGDVQFCEKPDALKRHLRKRLEGFGKNGKKSEKEG